MSEVGRYWRRDKSAPFATLLSMLETYYHPESRNDNYSALIERARESRPDDAKMATFRRELIEVLRGHREGLPPEAIGLAAADDEWDTDEEFLAWLWHELYPGEPVPSSASDSPG
jgi:hypothetical protein